MIARVPCEFMTLPDQQYLECVFCILFLKYFCHCENTSKAQKMNFLQFGITTCIQEVQYTTDFNRPFGGFFQIFSKQFYKSYTSTE